MNPINQGSNGINVDGRYRTMLIVWFSILMSVSIMFILTFIIERRVSEGDAPMLVWVLMALGFLFLALSFLLKRRLLAQSAKEQRLELVQSAMILAVALCEAIGMFGLLLYFVGATPYYYLFFILSAVGILLHMPRREQLLAASYKGQGLG
jgi:uncharacterized membrane protein